MVFVSSAGVAGAAILGAASLGSAAIGYFGSQNAANAQVNAENQALQYQQQQAAKTQPYIQAGYGAANTLATLTGANGTGPDFSSFYNSPDYQFALQQGTLGTTRYENAQGMGLSGGALKDIAGFTTGLASQQYGNYYNRLMQLATLGSNAATNNATNSIGVGNTIGAIGASQASGIIGGTNALAGGINSGIQNTILANAINRSSYAPNGASALSGVSGGGYNPNVTGTLY